MNSNTTNYNNVANNYDNYDNDNTNNIDSMTDSHCGWQYLGDLSHEHFPPGKTFEARHHLKLAINHPYGFKCTVEGRKKKSFTPIPYCPRLNPSETLRYQ